jgi:hypothetical protein
MYGNITNHLFRVKKLFTLNYLSLSGAVFITLILLSGVGKARMIYQIQGGNAILVCCKHLAMRLFSLCAQPYCPQTTVLFGVWTSIWLENLGRGVAAPCLIYLCWFYDGSIVLWFSNEENDIIYISTRINLLYGGSHGWYGDFVGSYNFRIYVEKNNSITTTAFAFICDCELFSNWRRDGRDIS